MYHDLSKATINFSVVEVADKYLESAHILLKNGEPTIAFIMAALAVEIYLKSFLVKRQLSSTNRLVNVVPRNMSHKLTKLFGHIKAADKGIILITKLGITEQSFTDELLKYEDYFTKLRYRYEEDTLRIASSGVIVLAEKLYKAVREIIDDERPQKTTMSR